MAVMIFVRLAISLFCRERYSPRILLEVMWYSIHDLAERLNGWVCTDWVVALLGRLSSISRVEPGRETRGRLMLFCLEGVLCLLVDLYMLLISTERVLNCLLYWLFFLLNIGSLIILTHLWLKNVSILLRSYHSLVILWVQRPLSFILAHILIGLKRLFDNPLVQLSSKLSFCIFDYLSFLISYTTWDSLSLLQSHCHREPFDFILALSIAPLRPRLHVHLIATWLK